MVEMPQGPVMERQTAEPCCLGWKPNSTLPLPGDLSQLLGNLCLSDFTCKMGTVLIELPHWRHQRSRKKMQVEWGPRQEGFQEGQGIF